MRRILLLLCCLLPLSILPVWGNEKVTPPTSPTATTPAEAELGKRTAEQIEHDCKLVKDDKALARLNAIVADIAPMTQRPDVIYTCKILDTPALNAESIPGGTVYVTKGLLDAVESDDELAGVLAHEIAHNSLRHVKKLMERESKASMMQIVTLIAAIYANKGDAVNAGQLLTMSELVKQALVNGYTTTLEAEADANAVTYLDKLKKYNPVGLYSVILGFRQIEEHHPTVELGYLKTHPYSDERRKLLEQKFKELHIPINLWAVVNFRAKVVPPLKGSADGTVLRLGDVNLFTYTTTATDMDPTTRAAEAALAINKRLLKDYIQQYEVDDDIHDGMLYINLRTVPVIALTQADANTRGMTLNALGSLIVQNIKTAIWHEAVKRS